MGAGPALLKDFCCCDAIHMRHTNIHQDHIGRCSCRIETFGGCEDCLSISFCFHDLNIWLQLKQLAKALAYHSLVVNNQYTDALCQVEPPSYYRWISIMPG